MIGRNMSLGATSKEYVCAKCGKTFYIPRQTKGGGRTQWVYKKRKNNKFLYFCSYSCFRE